MIHPESRFEHQGPVACPPLITEPWYQIRQRACDLSCLLDAERTGCSELSQFWPGPGCMQLCSDDRFHIYGPFGGAHCNNKYWTALSMFGSWSVQCVEIWVAWCFQGLIVVSNGVRLYPRPDLGDDTRGHLMLCRFSGVADNPFVVMPSGIRGIGKQWSILRIPAFFRIPKPSIKDMKQDECPHSQDSGACVEHCTEPCDLPRHPPRMKPQD